MIFGGKKKVNRNESSLDSIREKTDLAVDVENLVVKYKASEATVEAVNSISLKVKKKRTLGLVGETGAGKTTAMLALMNMVPNPPGVITDGIVKINGLDMLHLTSAQLQTVRGSEIAMIFQDPMTSLNPVLTVGEQIEESILLHQNVTKAEAVKEAKKLLATVGIDPKRVSEYPHQFSGGMRQRVGIAIALACNPSVLIADEPTSALDVTIQAQILQMMRKLKDENDTSMILITHDLGVVAEMCDDVAVMYAGHIVEYGTLEEVFNNTKHPYTEGLFDSLPNIHKRVEKLHPIQGLMPDPSNLPKGCTFAERCPYATDKCREQEPETFEFSETHRAACSAYRNSDFRIRRNK
mgnify:CR=1 FL=1